MEGFALLFYFKIIWDTESIIYDGWGEIFLKLGFPEIIWDISLSYSMKLKDEKADFKAPGLAEAFEGGVGVPQSYQRTKLWS